MPILMNFKLGWIDSGPINNNQVAKPRVQCHLVTNQNLHDQLQLFWNIEEAPSRKFDLKEELELHSLQNFKCDNETGIFIAKLLTCP